MRMPGVHVSTATALQEGPCRRKYAGAWGSEATPAAQPAAVTAAAAAGPESASVEAAFALVPCGFEREERARLLLAAGIGPRFVRNLERAGFSSMAEMRALGVHEVLRRMSTALGSPVVANRAQALARALGLQTCDRGGRRLATGRRMPARTDSHDIGGANA